MRCLEVVPVLVLAGLLAGCGAEPVRMLHERPSFTGRISLKSDTLSLAGELAFDRESGHCALTLRQPRTVALGRDREGQLSAFEDGKPRPFRPGEAARLRAVLALVDGNGVTDARARDDGYSVQLPKLGRVEVTVQEDETRPHGHHR